MTLVKKGYFTQRLWSPHLLLRASLASLDADGDKFTNKSSAPKSDDSLDDLEDSLSEEPTTCCMSGCANCVWLEYAEQLSKVLKSGDKAKELVMSKVTDPNMRAFLLMELKNFKKDGNETS